MPQVTSPIMGAYYRPPAKAILDHLAAGQALVLRADPYGETAGTEHNDPTAIAVFLVPDEQMRARFIDSDGQYTRAGAALSEALGGYGYTVEEIIHEKEWHVGYVKKEIAAEIGGLPESEDVAGSFRVGGQGGARVVFETPR